MHTCTTETTELGERNSLGVALSTEAYPEFMSGHKFLLLGQPTEGRRFRRTDSKEGS